jgi:hypothetical protein
MAKDRVASKAKKFPSNGGRMPERLAEGRGGGSLASCLNLKDGEQMALSYHELEDVALTNLERVEELEMQVMELENRLYDLETHVDDGYKDLEERMENLESAVASIAK